MKNFYLSKDRKGQSAIEYLMTYGWMLLVVAIVGGAIFATVQNQRQECSGEVPAVLDANQRSDAFGVTTFGVTTSGVEVELTNNGQDDVTVQTVRMGDSNNILNPGETISVGSSSSYTIPNTASSDSCATEELNVTFSPSGLSGNQRMTGNISAQMAIN